MMTLLRRIFSIGAPVAAGLVVNTDHQEMVIAAAAARARLDEQGLLQIELAAQEEIKEIVRAAGHGSAPTGARVPA